MAIETGSGRNEQGPPHRDGWQDLRVIVMLILTFPVAWLVPQKFWYPIARVAAGVLELIKKERPGQVERIRKIAGRNSFAVPPSQWEPPYTQKVVERLAFLRCYRPGGWHPVLRLEGREYIDAALKAGTGAILWFSPSVYSTMVSKMALHEAGFHLHYLSRYTHNLSTTLFGAKWINPLRMRVENRYLAGRLVIWPGAERETFEALKLRVQARGLVGITVYATARRLVETPFLGGKIRLATAPAYLALQNGVPLIPVFTAREADGVFRVTVNPPLQAGDESDQQKAIENLLREFAEQAGRFALQYPDQVGWRGAIRPDNSEATETGDEGSAELS